MTDARTTVFTKFGYAFSFISEETGKPVAQGEEVTDFRGNKGTLRGIGRIGRLGEPKVLVEDGRPGGEYNPSVWGLVAKSVDEK